MKDKPKLRAIQFEEDVKSFLERLEFDPESINGAKDSFRINGVQVDVCGGYENNLIVIDCTMRQELGKKSIRDKIKEWRGVASTLEKGFREHPVYKKYGFINFVIATKNIDIRKEDFVFANSERPRIYIWDDNFIAYYEDLYDKIKKYAKFNLLGEMCIRPSQQNTISVPAFLTSFRKTRMYTFMINPRDLLEVSYVARRETKNERFYQRIIKKERLKQIAHYVDDGEILPNNLIISFGEHLRKFIKFYPIQKDYVGRCSSSIGVQYGILEFPRDYRSCWIIDGQHRLYAFVNTDPNKWFNMPITAFENLDIEKQCKIFLDINKNQKPVPPDLVWDLNGDMIPSEEDGIISNSVKALNDFGSLHYKIYIPSKGIKKKHSLLKIAGVCLSIKRTRLARENTISKTMNPFYNQDYTMTVKNLSNALSDYFFCVKKLMEDYWKLENKGFVLDDGGNSVMIRLFEKIVSRCVNKGLPDDQDYEKYLKPIAVLLSERYKDKEELKKLKLTITSEGGKDELLKQFVLCIKQETGDQLFGGEIESTASQELRELERKLKELINKTLTKEKGENWFIEIPENISKKAIKNMEKHGEMDAKKAYLHIIFGECIAIMRKYNSLFYPIFRRGEHGFGSDAEIEVAFDFISRFKSTQTSHYVGLKKKTHDDTFFEMYIDKINKCIDPIIS